MAFDSQTDPIVYDGGWIKVRKTDKGFMYAERKGVESIALFLIRRTTTDIEVLVRYQPLCIDNTTPNLPIFPCAITGTIDAGDTPEQSAVQEALEEAGYKIEEVNLRLVTTYIVGTQTNEQVHLFWCDVTGLEPVEVKGDGSYHESLSKNQWEPFSNLKDYRYSACQIAYSRIPVALAKELFVKASDLVAEQVTEVVTAVADKTQEGLKAMSKFFGDMLK